MGPFTHNGNHLHHIYLNFTTHKELADSLSYIAEYVTYKWDRSRQKKKKTNKAMRMECKRDVKSKPWDFLGVSQHQWESISVEKLPISLSFLHIHETSEYNEPNPVFVNVNIKGEITHTATNMLLSPPTFKVPILSKNIITPYGVFDDYLNPMDRSG